jgi:methylmalonyl-CoA/ethylmalonyl-CoA epimerase
MTNPHLTFHHLGLATRKRDQAVTFLSALGYEIGESVFDPLQNVHLTMCTHKTEPAVEIICPGDTKGPIDNLVQRHPAGIIYHPCYQTDDLTAALASMEQAGNTALCVSPRKPAPLFGGLHVSFYNVPGIGLIEIVENNPA